MHSHAVRWSLAALDCMHTVQFTAPALGAMEPELHETQVLAPLDVANLPTAQGSQPSELVRTAKRPATQGVPAMAPS
jgi:hypothetical protein